MQEKIQKENKNKKLWFRRKRYGWGWVPVSWEGWLIIFVYVVALLSNFQTIDAVQYSSSDTLINFAPRFIILTVILIIICRVKGEKPKWSWGK
jgi:hypothetical protein